jgi:hypothetical protein
MRIFGQWRRGQGKERAATGSASLDEVGSFAGGRVREERWRCCRNTTSHTASFLSCASLPCVLMVEGRAPGLGTDAYILIARSLFVLFHTHIQHPLYSSRSFRTCKPHASTDIHPSVLIPYRSTNIMVSLTSLTSLLPLLLLALPGQAAPAPEKRYNVQVIDNCSNQGQVALTFDGTSSAHTGDICQPDTEMG